MTIGAIEAAPVGRPLTGARIETMLPRYEPGETVSPPHGGADRNSRSSTSWLTGSCRPLTGARIETSLWRDQNYWLTSPPHGGADRNNTWGKAVALNDVAPSRGRGSKHQAGLQRRRDFRSPPHGGADRNVPCMSPWSSRPSRPLTGARIETCFARPRNPISWVAPSRGRGSKLWDAYQGTIVTKSPPHGGADRNNRSAWAALTISCRPLTGARIETRSHISTTHQLLVAPSRGRGSKLLVAGVVSAVAERRPLTGARIETPHSSCSPALYFVAPSRGRGSKLPTRDIVHRHNRSPPHGGADRNSRRATGV